jgi:hypothetical protein
MQLDTKNLHLTMDRNFITNLTHAGNGQLYILRTNSISCYELIDWVDYIKSLLADQKVLLSLKIINGVIDQEPMSLRRIPKSREDIQREIESMLGLLTVKIWPMVDTEDVNRIKKHASLSMLTLIKAQMLNYL